MLYAILGMLFVAWAFVRAAAVARRNGTTLFVPRRRVNRLSTPPRRA